MKNNNKNYVGRDDDSGWIMVIVVAILVIATIIAIMVYAGAFIGLFHSVKNYVLSFKRNVIDSNRELQAA